MVEAPDFVPAFCGRELRAVGVVLEERLWNVPEAHRDLEEQSSLKLPLRRPAVNDLSYSVVVAFSDRREDPILELRVLASELQEITFSMIALRVQFSSEIGLTASQTMTVFPVSGSFCLECSRTNPSSRSS